MFNPLTGKKTVYLCETDHGESVVKIVETREEADVWLKQEIAKLNERREYWGEEKIRGDRRIQDRDGVYYKGTGIGYEIRDLG